MLKYRFINQSLSIDKIYGKIPSRFLTFVISVAKIVKTGLMIMNRHTLIYNCLFIKLHRKNLLTIPGAFFC